MELITGVSGTDDAGVTGNTDEHGPEARETRLAERKKRAEYRQIAGVKRRNKLPGDKDDYL